MKSTLEFNLPEEDEEFRTALDGHKFRHILSDLNEHLRSIMKYSSETYTQDQLDTYQEIRDYLLALVEEENVSL